MLENILGPHSIGQGMTIDTLELVRYHGFAAFDKLSGLARLGVFEVINNRVDMENKLMQLRLPHIIPFVQTVDENIVVQLS